MVKRIFLLLTLLLAAGCGLEKPTAPERPATETRFDWQGRSGAELLDRLRNSQQPPESLTGYFTLNMEPPPAGQFSNLSGILYLGRTEHGPRVRIKALGIFGRVLFDMVRDGDEMQMYIPSRRTLYQGALDNEMENGSPLGRVFSSLLVDLGSLKAVADVMPRQVAHEVVVALETGELALDSASGRISRYRTAEQEVRYRAYQQPEGGPAIPTEIELERLDGSGRASCSLSNLSFADNSASFSLAGYSPETIAPLSGLKAEAER